MKRIIFLTFLVFSLVMSAFSQEGNMWIGGTLNISSQSVGDVSRSTTTIMPEFGYHLNSNWAIGGRLGFSNEKEDFAAGTEKTNTTSIVPFARYTFGNIGDFQVFGQGELPLNFYGGEFPDGSSKSSSNSIALRVRPGISYAINDSWGFNMLMPSVFSFTSGSNDTSTFKFAVNDGYTVQGYLLSTAIGFVYKF